MSEAQEKYNTENTKQTFIQFAEIELIKAKYISLNHPKLNSTEFIEHLNSNFELKDVLLNCFRYLPGGQYINQVKNRCISILNKKSFDYSSKDNRYSNFQIAREWSEKYLTANHEINIVDPKMSFLILLGTKIARLTELLESGKTPNNESIEDSTLDLMNYRLLLEGFILELQ